MWLFVLAVTAASTLSGKNAIACPKPNTNKLSCLFCLLFCSFYSSTSWDYNRFWQYLTFNEQLLCTVMPKVLCLYYPHGNFIRLYYFHHHCCHPYVVAQRSSVSYLSDVRKVTIVACFSSAIFDKGGDWNIVRFFGAWWWVSVSYCAGISLPSPALISIHMLRGSELLGVIRASDLYLL